MEVLAWISATPALRIVERLALYIFAALAFLWIWLYRNLRTKSLAGTAAELGLMFFPKLPAEELSLPGASFYCPASTPRNCLRGMIAGRETVIFDLPIVSSMSNSPRENAIDGTVVGFRVSPDSYCRDRGVLQEASWHVEKMGEWVFVYHARPLVKPTKIAAYVEEARARFRQATDPKSYEPTTVSTLP